MRMWFFRHGRILPSGFAAAGFAVLVSSGPVLHGQSPQAPAPPKPAPAAPAPKSRPAAAKATLPSARSIIDRHIEAIGGRKAVLSHTSSHATGTMTMSGSGITGMVEIYAAKPNKSLVRINLGGIGEVIEGFDGVNAWTISPITGPSLTQGKELEDKKFDADFYSDLHDEGRYVSMKTVEETTFDGRACYKVSLVRKDGSEDFDFYDAATGLKAGAMVTRESQMGPTSVTQTTADYKKFGGLLLPTTLKQTAMGIEQVLKLTSIEFDNVPPTMFDPPAQIKALLK
jgi:hypothetical protein